MSEPLAARLPPEMFLLKMNRMEEAGAPPRPAAAPQAPLSAVPSTLLITLAARAQGDAMYPRVAVGDARAGALLRTLVADARPYLAHKPSIYGVLARTRLFRDLTAAFLERHPDAACANLGCGLADYFQWLDRGTNAWIDADLPEVTALRAPLLPAAADRQRLADVDLSQPGWWVRLGLPDAQQPDAQPPRPVPLICEGVLMYLQPELAQGFMREFGARAPEGSQLLFDAMCWLAAGRGARNPSVRHTGADFRWGPRRLGELTAAHPRLHLVAEHRVMEGRGLPYALLGPLFRRLFGLPFYALYQMGIRRDAS